MLESVAGVSILDACLESSNDAVDLVKTEKHCILRDNIRSLVSSGVDHPTAHLVAEVAADDRHACAAQGVGCGTMH